MRPHSLTLPRAALAALTALACNDQPTLTGAPDAAGPSLAAAGAPEQSGAVIRSPSTYGFSFADIGRGLFLFASTHQGFEFCGEQATVDILSSQHTVISQQDENTINQLTKGLAYVSVYALPDGFDFGDFDVFCALLTGPTLATGLTRFVAGDNDLNFDGSSSSRTDVFGAHTGGQVQLAGGGTANLSAGFKAHLHRSPSGEVSFEVPTSMIVLSGGN